ncbi:CIA30 family protein [Alphaproteobacteria bacterium]|nr:CIA30 family protein [Alphaproteobacteria bacterium]
MLILDDLNNNGKTYQNQNWLFVSDGVMGGLSEGIVYKDSISNIPCYRMTGNVTTKNNGGFLMTRTLLKPNLKAKDYTGIYIKVYGNDEDYFLHLKTSFTPAVWQYYGYKFKAVKKWKEIKVPFANFKRSNLYQPKSMSSQKIKNIAVVAGFNDYQSDICFSEIGFY